MKARAGLLEHVGLGLIIEWPSGVVFTNQTGGTSCLHPEMEGIFVPLRNDYDHSDGRLLSPETALLAYFEGPEHQGTGATKGLSAADADFITEVLMEYRLDDSIAVDRSRLQDSHEAWVHVIITQDEDDLAPAFSFPPYPRRGILTWSNSD